MKRVCIAINRLFDEEVKNQIVESLGINSIEEEVMYLYSDCEDVGYCILFFKGKEITSSPYIEILTNTFSLKGLYLITENSRIQFDLYNKGKSVYKLELRHPATISNEGNFQVISEGDMQMLTEFGKNIDLEKVENIIRGKGQYMFFSRTVGETLLTELGLQSLRPMLFWDWENLISYKDEAMQKKLIETGEFKNLQLIKILPGY